jgi:hypothetical protein
MNPYRLIAVNGYAAYRNTLVGNPAPAVRSAFERMTHPVPGDLVIETTSVPTWRAISLNVDASPGSTLGILLRVTQEPVVSQDELDRMHADGDYWTKPDETLADVPTERCWYIKPLDPTCEHAEYRWRNADFVAIHTYPAFVGHSPDAEYERLKSAES